MTKHEAVEYYGSEAELARKLQVTRSAVNQWEEIPAGRQFELEVLTDGDLKADRRPASDNAAA